MPKTKLEHVRGMHMWGNVSRGPVPGSLQPVLAAAIAFGSGVMQVYEFNQTQSSFYSNQEQLALLNANPTSLLMPTIGSFFLVWQYLRQNQLLVGIFKSVQSGGHLKR